VRFVRSFNLSRMPNTRNAARLSAFFEGCERGLNGGNPNRKRPSRRTAADFDLMDAEGNIYLGRGMYTLAMRVIVLQLDLAGPRWKRRPHAQGREKWARPFSA
jgi:hypothetical protein